MSVVSVSVRADERMDSQHLYREAHRAFTAGDFARAAQYFSTFEERYAEEPIFSNHMPRVRLALGTAWYNLGEYEEALPLLLAHVEQSPGAPTVRDTLYRIADIYFRQGAYEDARTTYTTLLSRYPAIPQREDILFQVATTYLLEDAYTNALPLLTTLGRTARTPEIAGAARAWALRCYYLTENYDDALVHLREMTAAGGSPDHLILMSTIALSLGDHYYDDFSYNAARDAYFCVVRRDEMLACQRTRLAELEQRIAETADAHDQRLVSERHRAMALAAQVKEGIAQLEARDDFDTAWLMRMGRCLFAMERYWEATIVFREVVEAFPAHTVAPQAAAQEVYALMQLRLFDHARDKVAVFIDTWPDDDAVPMMLFMRAESYINEEQYAEAEAALTELIAAHPSMPMSARARFYLALAQAMQEKFDDAIAGFDAWLATPEYARDRLRPNVAYWRCVATFFQGDYAEAIAHMKAFEKEFPDHPYTPDLQYRIGVCYYMQEDFVEAAGQLARFTSVHTNHAMIAEARNLRGDALAALGQLDAALRAYEAVTPAHGAYYHYAVTQRGKCLQALKRYEDMVTLYEDYITLAADTPNVVEGIYWLGWAHRRLEDLDAAREAYWHALTTYGNRREWTVFDGILRDMNTMYTGSNGVATLLARLSEERHAARQRGHLTLSSRMDMARYRTYTALGRADDAAHIAQHFSRMYTTNDLGADGLLFAAHYVREEHGAEAALHYYHLIQELFPNSAARAEAELRLAQITRETGDIIAAELHLEEAERYAEEMRIFVEIEFEKGQIALADGRYTQAITHFENVLANRAARGELWPRSLIGIAQTYERKGDFRKAIPYYQRVYVMYAGFADLLPIAYYHSGRGFEEIGDVSAAINTYRELRTHSALADTPEFAKAGERLAILSPTAGETP